MDHVLWTAGVDGIIQDVVRAENCYLYDSRGTRYVDLEAGTWAASLGHNHPRVVRAIQTQASRLIHTGSRYASPVLEEAARAVLEVVGFRGGRCTFLSSGSEAVEFAVKVGRAVADRPELLVMANAYFGSYGSAVDRVGKGWHSFDWTVCSGCSSLDQCHPSCRHFQSIPFERIGGFLLEPGSSAGIRFPPRPLVRTIARQVQLAGGLVIANEITTGIGRTGRWFGYQHDELRPDIVALGKGLGSGYPVSAIALDSAVASRLERTDFHYCQSHQNDPLGGAVAREVLQVIQEEELIERSRRIGADLMTELSSLARRHTAVREVRGRGMMIAIDLFQEGSANRAPAAGIRLLQRGYVVGAAAGNGRDLLRLDPSLTIEERDLEGFLAALEEVLGSLPG